MKRYQNWIVGDEPEQCIPIGDGKAESDTVRFFTAILTRWFDAHMPVWNVAQVKDALTVAATGWVVHVAEAERTAIIDEICLRYGIDKEGKES